MTTYEAGMMVLEIITLMMSILGIIITLLLIIIDKKTKK